MKTNIVIDIAAPTGKIKDQMLLANQIAGFFKM